MFASVRGMGVLPGCPRSSSLGSRTMIFFPPFHATFFLRREAGAPDARLTAALEGVRESLGVISRPTVGVLGPSINLATGVDSVVVSGVALSSDDAMAAVCAVLRPLALA